MKVNGYTVGDRDGPNETTHDEDGLPIPIDDGKFEYVESCLESGHSTLLQYCTLEEAREELEYHIDDCGLEEFKDHLDDAPELGVMFEAIREHEQRTFDGDNGEIELDSIHDRFLDIVFSDRDLTLRAMTAAFGDSCFVRFPAPLKCDLYHRDRGEERWTEGP